MRPSPGDLVVLPLIGAILMGAVSLAPAAAQAFTPYRLLVQAVQSPQRPLVYVQDRLLKMHLRKALLLAQPETALSVSSYVAGAHAYLVGWVDDAAQRDSLESAARGVQGLLSVAIYLPVKPTGADAPDSASELGLKAKVMAAIVAKSSAKKANVAVDVLGSHAVLVGLVQSAADVQSAVAAASATSGITGVTNFLDVPLSENTKPSRGLLQR
jgi:osmotically-inducible protein OsmY